MLSRTNLLVRTEESWLRYTASRTVRRHKSSAQKNDDEGTSGNSHGKHSKPPSTLFELTRSIQRFLSNSIDSNVSLARTKRPARVKPEKTIPETKPSSLALVSAAMDPTRLSDTAAEHNRAFQNASNDLIKSFNMYLAHASPSSEPSLTPKSMRAERKSPVHAHFSSVLHILDDILAEPKGSSSKSTTKRRKKQEQMSENSFRYDLAACGSEDQLIELFRNYFIRGKLSRPMATMMLWRSKLSTVEGMDALTSIIKGNAELSGWSPVVLKAFSKEVWLRRLILGPVISISKTQRASERQENSRLRTEFLKVFFASMFEVNWAPLMKSGELSNDAIRSLWYLAHLAENEFDILGKLVYGWAAEFGSFDIAEKVHLANAVSQMWCTGYSVRNARLLDISNSFFFNGDQSLTDDSDPVMYLAPVKLACIKFISALEGNESLRTGKDAPTLRKLFTLVQRDDVVRDLDFIMPALVFLERHKQNFDTNRELHEAGLCFLEFTETNAASVQRPLIMSDAFVATRIAQIATKIKRKQSRSEVKEVNDAVDSADALA
ncbi:uncharacterized protein V2V93DRAFT_366851 [Kockiozyma suomiensis]|uniref:uncharacterized protein n=1 Tax=Kockiozyma suomiensis TaxID=1337062 RepID=UPI0033430703